MRAGTLKNYGREVIVKCTDFSNDPICKISIAQKKTLTTPRKIIYTTGTDLIKLRSIKIRSICEENIFIFINEIFI